MNNNNVVFLVGGPGSGKDFVLRTALKESQATEIPLSKLAARIREQTDYPEVDGRPIIVSGNSDQGLDIELCQAVLESMGYTTAMVFVYTTNETSKSRSIISEEKRQSKYDASIKYMHYYKEVFAEAFFLFDNSSDFVTVNEETQAQMISWLQELTALVEGYFKEDVDVLFEKEFPTIVDMIAQKKNIKGVSQGDKYKGGISVAGNKATSREIVTSESADRHVITFSHNNAAYRVHKVGCPAAKETPHRTAWEHEGDAHSALAACHADESDKAGKPTKADAKICKCAKPVSESNQEVSVPQTQAKGVKYSKNRPAKGAKPPGETFDSRMGAVPSGGIGLTGYKEETEKPKPLSEIRRK